MTVEFPHQGILPKVETQATALLEAHPEYNGKGVLVAILDTGIDPGAPGLAETPDGRPKLVDTIDCSGSGDVDTSTVVEALPVDEAVADSEAKDAGAGGAAVVIQGLSGRKLKLSPEWRNPTGKWHVGIKRAQELYPNGLKARVKAERKKGWTIEHRKVEAELQRAAAAFKAAKGSKPPATTDEAEDAADMEARVAQLAEAGKGYDDAGCLYDCVVWHDGERWWAAVDVQEDGDLRGFEPMTDYRVQRQWATFNSSLDNLNFAVNIYEEGKVLSIVVDAGSHGTHVAGITAAYHKDQPELNGLAPGAQLVSLKIGDSRLGSMETGVSVVRALCDVVRLKCDMINMSYGEAVAVNETGRVMKLIEEVVNKHGVVYVGSASNNGPALSTVGAPAGSGTSAIAVGAYLSESMMLASYSLRKPFEGVNFTWSSVGPSYDGEQGPTIVAPGGAITSVPNWTLQKSQLMNGTSMSSPNSAGSIALVLSALKAQGIAYTPHLIRRAVTATAKDVGLHPLVQGHGMLQVAAALDYVKRFHGLPYAGLPLRVSVQGIKGNCRGVYLREAGESAVSRDFKVNVEPQFHEETATSAEKVNFEAHVALSLESKDIKAGSWVTIPNYFVVVNNGRGFNITVDGSRLPPGLHFSKVVGRDVNAPPEMGPLFTVPITVVKPLEFDPSGAVDAKATLAPAHQLLPVHGGVRRLGVHAFTSGQVERHFIVPPPGTTWMDVTLTDLRAHSPATGAAGAGDEGMADVQGPGPAAAGAPTGERDGRVVIVALQTVQLLPHTPFRDAEFERYVSLAPGQRETYSVQVVAGTTVEMALAQYAISEGRASVALDVEFRGLAPRVPEVALVGGQGFASVAVDSLVHDEELAPAAKLDRWQTKVVPASATIKPLGAERDVLPDGKQVYQLVMEYKFSVGEAGGEEITPRAPLLNGVLYESPFEAQFFMAYDGSKKLLGCGDAWPGSVKCPKGDVVVRVNVRHDELALLEGLKGMPLVLERGLKGGKEVAVPDYATREEAMLKRKAGGGPRMLRKGCSAAVFLGEPGFDKLPKGAKPGDVLLGSLTLEKAGKEQQPKSRRPKGFPLTYVVPPPLPEAPKPPSKPTPPDERPEEAKLADKVRDLKVAHLASVTDAAAFDALFAALEKEYPGHIPLLQVRLRFLDNEEGRAERLPAVVAAAEAVVKEVDQTALALHFGTKVDESDPVQVKTRGEMEEKKAALADALARKARALIDLKANNGGSKPEGKAGAAAAAAKEDGGSVVEVGEEKAEAVAPAAKAAEDDEVAAALKELAKWDALDKDAYARLVLERDARKNRWGLVVKLLNKLLADPGNSSGIPKEELYKRRYEAYETLGWSHLLENERKWRVIDCPKDYALF